MPFRSDTYHIELLLGSTDVESIWNWDQWVPIAERFEPVLTSDRGRTGVRCSQYVPHGAFRRCKGFGKLSWNQKSHQKWCHQSPVTRDECHNWRFGHLEAWAPDWNASSRQDSAPDIYFNIDNQTTVYDEDELAFNPVVVCAWKLDLPDVKHQELKQALVCLQSHLQCVLRATWVRPWGLPSGLGERFYTDAINDMPFQGTFAQENPHQGPVEPAMLQDGWVVKT